MKTAKEKLWLTEDGRIVKDGDPKAHELLALKGQVVPENRLARIKGADEHFLDNRPAAHVHAKTVAPEDVAQRSDRTVKPEVHRGHK